MGALVRELFKQGADAYGVDVSSVAANHCNNLMPGRFQAASVLALPFADDTFDTLVSTHCLEHLAPEDVERAFLEMHRVCRRNLYLCVATGPDRDGHWHLTKEKRGWWETSAFAAGFRKHSFYYAITPFDALENDANSITIPLEKIPKSVLIQHPLNDLVEHRDLHMDMSRETGRRSDAHMARYHLAAQYVRDGDTVLDGACGMGYGSHLLASQSSAAKIIGTDLDQSGIAYAKTNFANPSADRLTFHVSDAQYLEYVPDNSVDLFVSFETLEHVPHPEHLITAAKRVLRPGGRFIVSVPNLWVNAEGIDPNPHHLHVYDWRRLKREVESEFLLEAAFAQTAGGGMKLTKHPRLLIGFQPEGPQPVDAEWWLAIGMKSPLEGMNVPYVETALHWEGEPPNVVAFARDYENPWLVHSIVSLGWCSRNQSQRASIAKHVLAMSTANSPDTGAALCILGYDMLINPNELTLAKVHPYALRVKEFIDLGGLNSNYIRWVTSLWYVLGLLWKAVGDLEKSLQSFLNCADCKVHAYSPLLATKTVGACRIAGTLLFQAGRRDEAKTLWTKGISLAEKAIKGDWREIHGDIGSPFTFGLREAAEVLDCANRCADGLSHLALRDERAGLLDEPNLIARVDESERRLGQALSELNGLRSSAPARLVRALEADNRGFKRCVRVGYLLSIILFPPKIKVWLKPVAAILRKKFE